MEWISLNGRKHGECFLFKTDHFDVQLDSIAQTFTGEVGANRAGPPAAPRPQLALEELVARAKPAVLYLKGPDRSGTGFFVTDTGVIATNARHRLRAQRYGLNDRSSPFLSGRAVRRATGICCGLGRQFHRDTGL